MLIGVVSEADLLYKEEFRDGTPDRYTQLRRLTDLTKADALTAEQLMTSPALTTRPDTTLAEAARTMARAKVKRLPVVDELGVLQGVVSRADLLKVFLRGDEEIPEEVRREVVSYLFPPPSSALRVDVREGVVKLVGRIRDTALVPVAARLVRAVERVVDVEFELTADRPEEASGAGRPLLPGRRPRDIPARPAAGTREAPTAEKGRRPRAGEPAADATVVHQPSGGPGSVRGPARSVHVTSAPGVSRTSVACRRGIVLAYGGYPRRKITCGKAPQLSIRPVVTLRDGISSGCVWKATMTPWCAASSRTRWRPSPARSQASGSSRSVPSIATGPDREDRRSGGCGYMRVRPA